MAFKKKVQARILILLTLFFSVAMAEPIARMTDKGVIELGKTIAKQEKAVEKALPSKFKKSILRGPTGELMVKDYLSDLADAIKHLNDRFTGQYSASAEVTEILTRSSVMHDYFQANPDVKGVNEWDVYAGSLQQLASAYGEEFPLGEDAAVRRIGDKELADAAKQASAFANSFSKQLGKDTKKIKSLKDPVKDAQEELKLISKVSKTLESNIKKGKPSTAEAKQIMAAVAEVEDVLELEEMPESVLEAWDDGSRSIDKIEQAFAL